ncbi:MAG: class A beta-lactamase-related serine hydrolase [Bacteroidetes bacterium]|nr:MAG: class A beta-lactamase-related serine hydrolase [Bacteroidota bacterium]
MKKVFLSVIFTILLFACQKNNEIIPNSTSNFYFPAPNPNAIWENSTPEELAWDVSKINNLLTFLEQNNTRAFIVLKNGKIVMENYFNNNLLGTKFTASNNWYWASAGKTLTSFLIGKALEEKKLTLSQKSSDFLGKSWSSLSAEQEALITVKNHINMTTGLDDNVANKDCTTPNCFKYLTAPNTRWAYHNAPYTILDKLLEKATNQDFDSYFNSRLRDKIGMDGFWQYTDDNHVYFSTPRSMARFGLLILAKGKWQNEVILDEQNYYKEMLNSSQNINPSYGYLWWLNGKSSFMAPGLQTVFQRSLSPNAPADLVAALGKNGQLICVVPSQNLVVIRMGNNPDNSLVPINFHDQMWEKLNEVIKK